MTVNPASLPTSRLLSHLALAAILGVVLAVAVVAPIEFRIDLLGTGRFLGAATPPETVAIFHSGEPAPSQQAAYRTDTILITLQPMAGRSTAHEIEYKVRVKKGDLIAFGWRAVGTSVDEDLYFDFHGHQPGSTANNVGTYKQASGQSDQGFLFAPFDGVHGWYFQNSAAGAIKIELKVSGFYELVAPGQPGNEAGILPVDGK